MIHAITKTIYRHPKDTKNPLRHPRHKKIPVNIQDRQKKKHECANCLKVTERRVNSPQ